MLKPTKIWKSLFLNDDSVLKIVKNEDGSVYITIKEKSKIKDITLCKESRYSVMEFLKGE